MVNVSLWLLKCSDANIFILRKLVLLFRDFLKAISAKNCQRFLSEVLMLSFIPFAINVGAATV